jgi:hypothetical protein
MMCDRLRQAHLELTLSVERRSTIFDLDSCNLFLVRGIWITNIFLQVFSAFKPSSLQAFAYDHVYFE